MAAKAAGDFSEVLRGIDETLSAAGYGLIIANLDNSAAKEARYADLAVVGQPSRDEPNVAFASELANAVIMGSGRPVLFVPYTGQFKTVGARIMIAWKDSRESARAVADALPWPRLAGALISLPV